MLRAPCLSDLIFKAPKPTNTLSHFCDRLAILLVRLSQVQQQRQTQRCPLLDFDDARRNTELNDGLDLDASGVVDGLGLESLQSHCSGEEEFQTLLNGREEVLSVGVVDAHSLLVLPLDAVDDRKHALNVLDPFCYSSQFLLLLGHGLESDTCVPVHPLGDRAHACYLIEH